MNECWRLLDEFRNFCLSDETEKVYQELKSYQIIELVQCFLDILMKANSYASGQLGKVTT